MVDSMHTYVHAEAHIGLIVQARPTDRRAPGRAGARVTTSRPAGCQELGRVSTS